MDVKGIFSHSIVKMMMCTHADTKSDSHNTTCNDCGILLNTDIMIIALDNALDMESRRIANEILDSGRGYTVCNHINKDIDGGTPFCTGCALMFKDEIVYTNELRDPDHDPDHYLPRRPAKTKGNTKGVTPKPRKQDPKVVKTRSEPKEPEIIPKNVKDLITIAKSRGVKGSTSMSKKKLCEILGLEIVKPDMLVLRNKDTGEEHRFKSIYQASKEMNVNPGLIHHHIDASGVITIDGVVYDVCKI